MVMNEVLMSIRPEWVEKISFGIKTIEVRKSRPKCDHPSKVYIYCTKGAMPFFTREIFEVDDEQLNIPHVGNGKVVGEFICRQITEFGNKISDANLMDVCEKSCVPLYDLLVYIGGKKGYGWHISELVIYDEPIPLADFLRDYGVASHRPPQSWYYLGGAIDDD